MLIIARKVSGTRNGVDWPSVGQPVPDDMPEAEVDNLRAAGIVAEIPDKAILPKAVVSFDEVETAVAPEAEVAEPEAAEVAEVVEPETRVAPSARRRRG